MVITKYITKSTIVSPLASKTKPDVLKELTHLLFEKKKMKSVGPALDQIVAREATESTGIGNGIAVPHARIPGMKNLACAVGIAPDSLEFMAVDRKPVQIVFLICYPPSQQTTYLNFVASAVKMLSDKKTQEAVVSSVTAEEIHSCLKEISTAYVADQDDEVRKMKADPAIARTKDGHADLILLARLQLHEEMLSAAKSGKTQIKNRIIGIRSLVDARVLKHYDKLMARRAPALVPVEGDTCQGCFIRLPTKFVQQVRQDGEHINTCTNCSRYIYVV